TSIFGSFAFAVIGVVGVGVITFIVVITFKFIFIIVGTSLGTIGGFTPWCFLAFGSTFTLALWFTFGFAFGFTLACRCIVTIRGWRLRWLREFFLRIQFDQCFGYLERYVAHLAGTDSADSLFDLFKKRLPEFGFGFIAPCLLAHPQNKAVDRMR